MKLVEMGRESKCRYCTNNRTSQEIRGGGRKGSPCCAACWLGQRAARNAEVAAQAAVQDLTDGEWLEGGWRAARDL